MLNSEYGFHPTWVAPFYLELMGANFLRLSPSKQAEFADSLRIPLRTITPAILTAMLQDTNWRSRCVAAWFVGFLRADAFHGMVCTGLYRHPFHAESYCFALLRLGDQHTAGCFTRYLAHFLAPERVDYDSESLSVDWALASLQWLDHMQGTDHADVFLSQQGLWYQFAGSGLDRLAERYHWPTPPSESARQNWWKRWDFERTQAKLVAVMAFAEQRIDRTSSAAEE